MMKPQRSIPAVQRQHDDDGVGTTLAPADADDDAGLWVGAALPSSLMIVILQQCYSNRNNITFSHQGRTCIMAVFVSSSSGCSVALVVLLVVGIYKTLTPKYSQGTVGL